MLSSDISISNTYGRKYDQPIPSFLSQVPRFILTNGNKGIRVSIDVRTAIFVYNPAIHPHENTMDLIQPKINIFNIALYLEATRLAALFV